MQERSLSTTFVNRLTITMTSCSETEEEMDEEDSNKENCSWETDKTVGTLEAMSIHLNCGHSSVWLMRHASIWLSLYSTQKSMLIESKMPWKYQKHPSNVPLVTRLSLLQTMIYYWDPNPTIVLCSWLVSGKIRRLTSSLSMEGQPLISCQIHNAWPRNHNWGTFEKLDNDSGVQPRRSVCHRHDSC